MSIRGFFTPTKQKNGKSSTENDNDDPINSILPSTFVSDSSINSANEAVKEVIKSGTKRKRGAYVNYDDETRAKIAKYACVNGNASAARHFTKTLSLEKPMNESTVRSLKSAYKRELSKTPEKSIDTLPKYEKCGRPKLLGKYDEDVINYIKSLRESGSVVNRQILIAGARGIVVSKNKFILEEFGGHVKLSRSWAESFLRRVGYVRRKGTKAARKLPFDFEDQKLAFISRVQDTKQKYSIPDELVINFDQTNISIIPCGNWTMAEQGNVQTCHTD